MEEKGWRYVRLKPREVELLLLLARSADPESLKPRYRDTLPAVTAALERHFEKRREKPSALFHG